MIDALLILAIAALLAVLVRRDLQRAAARQRLRAWLRANPQALEMQRRFAAMQRQIAKALMPSMREAAAAFGRLAQAGARQPGDRKGPRR